MLPSRPLIRSAGTAILVAAAWGATTLPAAAPASASTFGGDGLIAFTSSSGPHATDIWVAGSTGTGPVDVTRDKGGGHSQPAFLPDGRSFVSRTALPKKPGDLYQSEPMGGRYHQITHTPTADESEPNLSPGGGTIAFSRSPWSNGHAGPGDIWTAQITGGNAQPLIVADGDDTQPAYSQNGEFVAFASNRAGHGYGIYRIDLWSAPNPPFNVSLVVASGSNPNWNPNQKKIVYDDSGDIWLVPINPRTGLPSGSPLRLTHHPKGAPDTSPQFSPRMDRILWQRGTSIWAMTPGGKGQHKLKGIGLNARQPDEQPKCTVQPQTDHNDVMKGTNGPDLFCASTGTDTMYGYGGNDVLFGGSGHDVIHSGAGNDLALSGGNDSTAGDTIYGDAGDDVLIGSPRDDTITGGPGSDRMIGQDGNDTLNGKDGVGQNDYLQGGPGRDTCRADLGDTVYC